MVGPQASGLPEMWGQGLAQPGPSSEVPRVGQGRDCLLLLLVVLQGLLQAGPQLLCLEEAAVRKGMRVAESQGESDG